MDRDLKIYLLGFGSGFIAFQIANHFFIKKSIKYDNKYDIEYDIKYDTKSTNTENIDESELVSDDNPNDTSFLSDEQNKDEISSNWRLIKEYVLSI